MFAAPSISPVSNTNPSFRVFEYESSTGSLVDYHEYYSDLINNQIQVRRSVLRKLCSSSHYTSDRLS